LLHWRVGSLQLLDTCMQSLTTGLWPGTGQLTFRIFVDYLLVIYLRQTLFLCNNSKIRLFLSAKEVLLRLRSVSFF
jgi:hypothetical protein